MKKLLLSLVASLGLMGGAQAATFQSLAAGGSASLYGDYSTDGVLAFDLDFHSLGTTTLNYVVGAADTAGLSFSAMLNNFTGGAITGFNFVISGGEFAYSGTVTRLFNGLLLSDVNFNGASAGIDFGGAEFGDVELGNALVGSATPTPGALDWTINGLSAGDVLSISVTAVPEPESIAMLLAGLGVIGAVARRRQRFLAA